MPGMIRAPGFVTEAQARDVKAVASQELPDYMEGVTTAEAEREQHRRTEHRICFHNAPFTEPAHNGTYGRLPDTPNSQAVPASRKYSSR